MPTPVTSMFKLDTKLRAKASPALIAADAEHFARIVECLNTRLTRLDSRLERLRMTPKGQGQEAVSRDLDIHRLSAERSLLSRFGVDLCLGRMVFDDDAAGQRTVYIGRFGLTDDQGRRLLIDWRAPAARPFFAATHADPLGLASRRRYRWASGSVRDYWDEAFTTHSLGQLASLDAQSAFIAGLGASRSPQMRDVLSTIQADQDAIIRSPFAGALVVDGGPGTGKTVVALHRAAYLLHSDQRITRGGVLFIGPHESYLDYIDDVLPSLGEEGVSTCLLRDLVAEGPVAVDEPHEEVLRLKATVDMVHAVETAVSLSEKPPTEAYDLETQWADITIDAHDWAEAFAVPAPGAPHNESRADVWQALIEIVADRLLSEDPVGEVLVGDEATVQQLGRELVDDELHERFERAWPVLDPVKIVADLWSVPTYLHRCAPWLGQDQVRMLQREDPRAWTVADLPLLDAARHRVGDPRTARRAEQRATALATASQYMDQVIDELVAADDSELMPLRMLQGDDLQRALVDETAAPAEHVDRLAGPFAHIIVDEAQDLTDAEWLMLARRCPSRSLTVVGDRAQDRRGFPESWSRRLERVGFTRNSLASLTINYRTPEEVMEAAEPIIREALPDANVPRSARRSGKPVVYGSPDQLSTTLETWLTEHDDGICCVIPFCGQKQIDEIKSSVSALATRFGPARVRTLSARRAKGLEFDLVVVVDAAVPPQATVREAVDSYVAMTRATQQLVMLRTGSAADAK